MESLHTEFTNGTSIPVNDEYSLLNEIAESNKYWKLLVERKSEFLSYKLKNYLIAEIDRLSDEDDWVVGDIPITRKSIQAFMKLLIELNPETFPGITCDNEGRIIMYWRRGDDVARFRIYSRNWIRWYVTLKEGEKEVRLFKSGSLSKTTREVKNIELFHQKLLKI